MNTTAAATIAQLVARAKGYNPTYTGSPEPIRKATKVIDGHLVQVSVIGWEDRIVVELDRSTEPLTIAQAVERIAA